MRVDDPDALARILSGTMLEGRAVERLDLGGPAALRGSVPDRHRGDPVFVVACSDDELQDAFSAVLSVVPATGRWPVATAAWGPDPLAEVLYGRVLPLSELPEPMSESALDDELARRFATVDAFRFHDHAARLANILAETEHRTGRAPSLDDIRTELGDDIGELGLDRWLFGWEQSIRGGGDVEPVLDAYLSFFEPKGQPCGIVLTATSTPWQAAACLDFFGIGSMDDVPFFASLLKRWHDRWGAEIYASFGTMLEFRVRLPPGRPDDLIGVATEQYLLAPCTTVLPGVSLRHHARALSARERWFLHERP